MRMSFVLLTILPTIILISVLTAYPLIYSIYVSLCQFNPTTASSETFRGFLNYSLLLNDPRFWSSLQTTITIAGFGVVSEFFIGLGLALLMNKEIKGKGLITTILILPMMLPPVIVGLIWRMQLNKFFGFINYFLASFGIDSPDWLGVPEWALPSVIFVDIWQWTPFVFLILLAGLQSLPREPIEAAQIDGASQWQLLKYVTLPMLVPFMLIALFLRSIDALKLFDVVYILTMGGPAFTTETASLYIFRQCFINYDIGYSAALSYFLLLIVMIFFIFLSRLQIIKERI